MSAFDTNTLKSEINTILGKSGELMELSNDAKSKITPNKDISKSSNTTLDRSLVTENELLNQSILSDVIERPHNVIIFIKYFLMSYFSLISICNLLNFVAQ